jgi:ubiquinone/menaquinone biosynthesis C-methylase UbiE
MDDTPRWQRYWDRHAAAYDRQMKLWDRRLFRDNRSWVCRQASGDVLEVAIGTGLNLPDYPDEVRLTGVDYSAGMLELARQRAATLGRDVELHLGDAQALDFADASFDTVVCTYGLCAIPEEGRAVAEMWRVLRPGGRLLLADHVAGAGRTVRAGQRMLELITVRQAGEHFLRRPRDTVRALGFEIEREDRFALGIVERVAARKPAPAVS